MISKFSLTVGVVKNQNDKIIFVTVSLQCYYMSQLCLANILESLLQYT